MRKKTIVQIESIYPEFARQIYRSSPNLANQPFHVQIRSILESGWSAGQNVVPHLNPSAWRRHYIIPTNAEAQHAWARETGHSVPQSLAEIFLLQLLRIQPDVVYLSDIGSFPFQLLDHLPKRPLIVAWLATRPPTDIPWGKIDILLSGVSAIRTECQNRGVKRAVDFNSGTPPYTELNLKSPSVRSNSVAFSGSFYSNYHDDRITLFQDLAHSICDLPITINIYTHSALNSSTNSMTIHPAVYGKEVITTYAEHLVVVDGRADFGLGEKRFRRDTSNMRIFEATRSGSLLIEEYAPNLEQMFDIGKEILCYHSDEELFDLVRFYCSAEHSSLSAKIARAGQRRATVSHSMEIRAQQFEDIITKELI